MKKKDVFKIIIGFSIWFLVMGILYYIFYMQRVETTFSKAKVDTKNSIVLNSVIGKIENVKYNNFLIWMSQKEGYECVPMKVYTKNKNYKVCVILNEEDFKEKPIGYIVNNKIYMEEGN